MHDTPAVDDLLLTARAALLDELLPMLPAQSHYTARMIAHAIGIAARESRAQPLPDALLAELAALAGIDEAPRGHEAANERAGQAKPAHGHGVANALSDLHEPARGDDVANALAGRHETAHDHDVANALAGRHETAHDHDVANALADRLRNGAFDRDASLRARLHAALVAWTAARVRVNESRSATATARPVKDPR